MSSYAALICVIFSVTPGFVRNAAGSENVSLSNNALNVSEQVELAEVRTKSKDMIHATLPFVLRSEGFIECQGAKSETAGNFFGQILGDDINYNRSDYLCAPTCRGTCVPRPLDVGIPKDNLPYGCLCSAHGCDLNGPRVAPMAQPHFKMVCKEERRCTCFGMGPGQYNGYSCEWINTISRLPITFTEKAMMLPGTHGRPILLPGKKGINRFSPIKWCSCCPRFPLVKNTYFSK